MVRQTLGYAVKILILASVVFVIFGVSTDVYATCIEKIDGTGYCCSAPQGPLNCHTYTEEELEQRRIEAEKWAAKNKILQEKAKRRYEANEKARKERELEYNLPKNIEQRRIWAEYEDRRRREESRRKLASQAAEIKRLRKEVKEIEVVWSPGLAFEFGAGLTLGLQSKPSLQNYVFFTGATLSSGLSWTSEFNDSSLINPDSLEDIMLGLMTLGIGLIPLSAWVGNDHGVRVRGDLFMANMADPLHGHLLFEPIARVVSSDGRWRASSFLQYFLPSIGIEWHHGDSNLVLSAPSITGAWLLSKHLAMEVSLRAVHRKLPEGWSTGGQINFQLLHVN